VTRQAGAASGDHEHPDGGVDWWTVLDITVWVAVVIIAGLGLEWLVGYLVRERIARGAGRFLAARQATTEPPSTQSAP